jgi:site-specific recombinase XerD
MADTKYIKLRHNVWYFQRRVPKALTSLYPSQTMIEEPLETGDIRVARQKRDVILGKMQQQLLDIKNSNPEKIRFQKYVDQMSIAKAGGNYGTDYHPLYWHDVMDPYTAKKEKDQAYNDAFSTVLNGQITHKNYRLTFREVLSKFIIESKAESQHTSGTLDRYTKTINMFLSLLNNKEFPLEDIDRELALDFIAQHRRNMSGSTLYGHISRLKTLWEFAYRHAWIRGDNPFDRHMINTTKDRKKKQPFSSEEMSTLIKIVQQESPSMRLLVWVGLYTGARISELISIKITSIKEENELLMVGIALDHQGKTQAASRSIPIPSRCIELFNFVKIEAESISSKYLFHDLVTIRDDGRLAYGVTKAFGVIKKKHITTSSDKGFHSFRVMMATALQQAGVSELIAAYLLGHSRKGLTMSYGYYSKGYMPKQLAEAQDKVVLAFDGYSGQRINLN